MITLLRLDERLIHGQIAIKWSRHTGVDHIVVANDAAASSKLIQKSLMMAAPANIKTVIKSMDDAIKLLNDPRCEAMKILVLVKNPWDCVKMINSVPDIHKINIGNYGRVEPENEGHPRKAYGTQIYIDDTELEDFRKIAECGIKAVYQTTPEDPELELKKVLG